MLAGRVLDLDFGSLGLHRLVDLAGIGNLSFVFRKSHNAQVVFAVSKRMLSKTKATKLDRSVRGRVLWGDSWFVLWCASWFVLWLNSGLNLLLWDVLLSP